MPALQAEDLVKALERQGRPIPRELADAIHPDKRPAQIASQAAQTPYWIARYDASPFAQLWRGLGITVYVATITVGRMLKATWRNIRR